MTKFHEEILEQAYRIRDYLRGKVMLEGRNTLHLQILLQMCEVCGFMEEAFKLEDEQE